MKISATWDNSGDISRESLCTITVEGEDGIGLDDLIRTYIRPMLISMGYNNELISEFLGDE